MLQKKMLTTPNKIVGSCIFALKLGKSTVMIHAWFVREVVGNQTVMIHAWFVREVVGNQTEDWPILLIYKKEVNSTPNSHMIERTSWLEPVVCGHDQIIACTISQGEDILSFLSILILKYNF
jgi:hypothetical protein